jgi:hypothetical protein
LNGTHELPAYNDNVKIFGENLNTVKKSGEVLLLPGRETGLEVQTERTKCMVMSRHRSTRQNNNLLISNKLFENAAKFIYDIWEEQ